MANFNNGTKRFQLQDLTGQKFGSWSVLRLDPGNSRKCIAVCVCGKEKSIHKQSLTDGRSQSCGCVSFSVGSIRRPHGHTWRKNGEVGATPEYISWVAMKGRCYRPHNASYKSYGERGIKVCERWRNCFENFLMDMGEKPSLSHTLDRIDVNADYGPSNCRWATKKEQTANRKCTCLIEFNGITKPITRWCEEYGIKRDVVYMRIKNGWGVLKSLTTPVRKQASRPRASVMSPINHGADMSAQNSTVDIGLKSALAGS